MDFLAGAGWAEARRVRLAGDASDRRYDRLTGPAGTAVLMDAPPGGVDDTAAFVRIARHLAGIGLSAPRILAEDTAQGFLLLEDLGDDLYPRTVAHDGASERQLYETAADVLRHLQSCPAPSGLPDLSPAGWADAATLAIHWYGRAATGTSADDCAFTACLATLIARYADGPRVLILRDYHAENLLWLPGRSGLARTGLLDFQLAQMGQPGYDLVSLLQDARRDVPEGLERHILDRIGAGPEFTAAYAVLGAQRALRILGIFARLCLVSGKPAYLPLIPRVWGHLHRNLAHPACRPLATLCADLLPAPTPALLQRIGAQCGTHPEG